MPKIAVSKYWKGHDDDAARNWEQVNGSNVRQASSARVMENLAHGVNHLAARTPRPDFGKSQSIANADTVGATPLYEWRYDDSIDNEDSFEFTVVSVPRTSAASSNYYIEQWADANHYDGNAVGTYSNATASAVNKYYDATYEIIPATRPSGKLGGEVIDGVTTTNGYTALHVGVQSRPMYWLDTDTHIYCDPTLAKKGGKVLADAAEDIRDTFHTLRTTNLPIVLSWSEQGQSTNARAHTNSVYSNLFDNSYGTDRNSDTPGATYDAQYCSTGNLDQRAQANVKVLCRILANAKMGTENVTNVMFWGPLGNCVIPVAANQSDLQWCGDSTSFIYLDANVAGTVADATCNKIDVLAAVHATATDYLNWKAIRCWVAE